jgi:hypothetical protein
LLSKIHFIFQYLILRLSNGKTKDFKKSHILFFCHDDNRGIDLDGRAYAQILDSFKDDFEQLGFSCLSISHPYSSLTSNLGYGFPVSINRNYFFARLKDHIYQLLGKYSNSIGDMYELIFNKTECRLIISIGSPTELARIARKKNIFHLELLHGIGYTFIPWGWDQLEVEKLPQGILAFDEVSFSTFSKLTSKGIYIRTIPHPFLKKFTHKNLEKIPNEWKMKRTIGIGYSKRILVSLTWGYAGDEGEIHQFANILPNGLFYEELAEVISKTKDEIFWHFRFHPCHLRQKKYKKLLLFMDEFVKNNPNTEWEMSSKLPLPSVVVNCDGNITMSSMSCYEAAAMGVKTLVLCPTMRNDEIWKDYFSDLEEEGYVNKEQVNVNMLLNWVENVSKTEPRLSNLLDENSWNHNINWILNKSNLV